MAVDGRVLEAVEDLHVALRNRGERLALAESCTGGLVGAALTAVGGASDVFTHGVITYSNSAKVELLSVPASTIDVTGAVSGPTARAMAVGARDRLEDTAWGVAITGLAGPSGGRPGKPVGTVYIAVASDVAGEARSIAQRYRFDGDREAIRRQSVVAALQLVHRTIDQAGHPSSPR